MKSYLNLVTKYLSIHKKKTRLTIVSIAMSVALITGVFSMLDAFLRFEKLQVIHDYGNYHILIKNASNEEKAIISSRVDVKNSGRWRDLGKGSINNIQCILGSIDENFTGNLNINIIKGSYPKSKNQIILEQWAMERISPDLTVGDTVKVMFQDNIERELQISGIFNDVGGLKANGIPAVLISMDMAVSLAEYKHDLLLIEFKDKVNIMKAEKDIKSSLGIAENRVDRNNHLLAVIGQSTHKAATGLYIVGGVLFLLVLIAGIVMIYNTFNISVMERTRQFGLLRCLGAAPSQIEKLVKREGLYITFIAIPVGVLAGMFMTFVCSAILKFFTAWIFGRMPLFTISISGIAAGVAIGFLTVIIATQLPAKKAARVSPLNAVTGSNEIRIPKSKKKGFLTKLFHAEIAMGINNALVKKKTLILMSCSIAISISIFLGFQVFVDFMYSSLKVVKPYSPDVSIISEQGISYTVLEKVSAIKGVKRAYGRMFAHVDATFDAARLTNEYKTKIGEIKVRENGLFVAPEKSWLISYDKNQLNWAKIDLLKGTVDEEKINKQNGIIAVARTVSKGISSMTANFEVGDRVYIETHEGTRELTVMGVLSTVPFSDSNQNLTTFITTEKIYKELIGRSDLQVIDIQLNKSNQEQTVKEIKAIAGGSMNFFDSRQKNAEINQTFMTMAVFIYGFVIVIALISILNIINTMNMSVANKTKYLGVMRAIGMTGEQLNKMVLMEAAIYSFLGCVAGCGFGILLQKFLITNFMRQFILVWKFPGIQIVLILIITMVVTAVSIISPLRRIKSRGIAEVVSSL